MTETATATSYAAEQWDDLYRNGRYRDEPPVPFVGTILDSLNDVDRKGYGLYVGCGNGRNYLPLVAAGLKLHGIDVSREGIRQIRTMIPDTENSTFVGDFGNYQGANVFRYIVAIQVFQHGDRSTTDNLFERSAEALQPGGKLFLRVNSSSPNLIHKHRVVEGNKRTGKTVLYKEGPKAGQQVHYYAQPELANLAGKHGFSIIQPMAEVIEQRQPPLKGHWAQWETIWQKEKP
ncbi:MAG TPA: class I SAM-dependent methyltransferase [Candidatus Saccharimonadales bacterium]|nr:class I SAM-dependent methyltransferase [Candidatus Saccharimonadales bacterium]